MTGAVFYGISAAGLVALVEPLFEDVLLAGGDQPGLLAGFGGDGADAAAPPTGGVEGFFAKFNLKRHFDNFYEYLKAVFGIDDNNVVYFVPLLVVVIFLLRSLANFVSSYSFQRIGLGMTTDIRNDLYRRVLEQSSRFHAEHSSGELMSRIVNDVGLIQSSVSYRVVDMLQQPLTLLSLLVLLLSTQFKLALVSIVLLPAFVYPIVRFGKGMRRTSHRSQERVADFAVLVGEGVRGHRVVKAFGMEEFEYGRFRHATRRHLRVNLWAQFLTSLSSPVIESIGVVCIAGLLVWAGLQIRAENLSAPLFVSFLVNLFLMYEPIRKLNKVNLVLQQSLAAVKRVMGIMAAPNEIQDVEGAVGIDGVKKQISFERVSFSYGDDLVLKDVNLLARRGEVVALVGPSGAGKSTLINLLPRFFDPNAGRVAIDGMDIRELKLASLRALIGLVTQDTVLFDDSIRNNIAYGRRDLPLERIRSAAKAAFADDFIMRTPEGYDSRVGESGVRLSGGQRQRLAIARALLKDAPILILDEATSHLDSHSEALVQKALANLMKGRTTLVIAHRLSTVMNADRIVVMESGRIAEEGAHEELIANGGLYKMLYDLQFEI